MTLRRESSILGTSMEAHDGSTWADTLRVCEQVAGFSVQWRKGVQCVGSASNTLQEAVHREWKLSTA